MESKLKVGVIALLLLAATLVAYSFAQAAVVSHTPAQISPQGAGSGLDADKLQSLSLPAVKLETGWTTSGTHVITTAAGSVGIGINPPAEKLHVTGKIRSDTGLCIGTSCITSWSQAAPPKGFIKTIGGAGSETGYSVKRTIDGGYIIAGSTTSSPAQGTDGYLVKLDKDGNVQWSKVFGGSGTDVLRGVVQVIDGSYVVVGYTNSGTTTVDGITSNPTQGNYDGWYLKFNSNGNAVWNKVFGNEYDNLLYAVNSDKVIYGSGDHVVAVGTYQFLGISYHYSAWFLLIGPTGNLVYNTWDENEPPRFGAAYYSIAPYYVNNWFYAVGKDGVIAVLDYSGGHPINPVFAGKGCGPTALYGAATMVRYPGAGVPGVSVGEYSDCFVGALPHPLSYTPGQNTITYGGSGEGKGYAAAQSILDNVETKYVLAGYYINGVGNRDVWFTKTKYNGPTEWTKTFGGAGTDVAYSIDQTIVGGYVIAGETTSFGANGQDILLIKTDYNGDV